MYDVHDVLPPTRPVTAADAGLRATLSELVVHVPCGGIRGPIGRLATRCDCDVNKGTWQSCRCEDEPVRWAGADVSREVELCVLCARGTAGGTTRWAWIGCADCLRANDRAARLAGVRPLPLARHSLLNGAAIAADAVGEDFRRQHVEVAATVRSWSALREWFHGEVARLAASCGWPADGQVLLRTWRERLPASAEASRDALRRLTGIDVGCATGR